MVLENNITMIVAGEKQGNHKICGKARYLRIGRLQFWKETPVESTYSDE